MQFTIVDTDADSERVTRRRAARFAARHTLWDESSLPRVRNCGRARASNSAGVTVKRAADGSVGLGGLQHCASVWACPVCSSTIAARRQGEIAQALGNWQTKHGGRVVFGTFTMRHHKGQSLKSLWAALSKAWGNVTSGRGWVEDALDFGTVTLERRVSKKGKVSTRAKGKLRFIRVIEVTHGENGWHVHVHALFLIPGKDRDVEALKAVVAQMESRFFGRWLSGLQSVGMSATRKHGADLRLLTGEGSSAALADYFAKGVYAASMETARGDLKKTKADGSRTPFQILEDVVARGEVDDLETWQEWERASKGKRQMFWSRGLKDELGVGEVDDQTLVDEAEEQGEPVAVIDSETWDVIAAERADYRLIAAFNISDGAGLALLARFAARTGRYSPPIRA